MVYKYIQQVVAGLAILLAAPIIAVCYIAVKFTSHGPFLFTQLRAGKDGKPFLIYKIRTMVTGAEKLQHKLKQKNEADGPVFKIRQDPRYTRIGAFLSHTALDELPQLFNIMKGDMAFVGPRPLPVSEAKKVPKKYSSRFSVLPGMTSSWIVGGAHAISFRKWMELDCEYALHKNINTDIQILLGTVKVMVRGIFKG